MNWKKEAAEKLQRYDAMRQAYCNIPQEIQRLEIAFCAAKGVNLEKCTGKGNGCREDALINNLAKRQELQWIWEQTRCWLEVTERAMRCLSQEEKLILQRMYISPEKGGLERLCKELGVEQSSVYRRRDRALERFAMALYGIPS